MSLELGSNSFPFENPGDSVEGEIVSVTEMQQTDMDDGSPRFWDAAGTRPVMMPVIELQTGLRDDSSDDGRRLVYLSGNRFTAVKRATRRLDEGAWLRVTFTEFSDREPAKKGYSRAKLFSAEYRAAVNGINLTEPVTRATVPVTGAVLPAAAASALTEEQKISLRALGVDV